MFLFFFLMKRRPPRSTRTDTLFPYTTLFRSKSIAKPVTKIGVIGAGLMAQQFALLFVRRLKVPVVITDLDQAHVEAGIAYIHGEIDALLRSEEHTSELQSLMRISYAVFCLKKKKKKNMDKRTNNQHTQM